MEMYRKVNYNNFCLIEELLNKKGYKLTNQRKDILAVFVNNSQKHISAEKLYFILKNNGVGISTIYRNIKIFTQLGIIKEFKVDDRNYYELKMYAKKPLHIHLKCEKCGKIEDIENKEIILQYLKLNKKLEEIYDAEIYDVDIMFQGICKNCK